jgi:transcriptional regulator with XRE-family HTH domain
MTPFPEWLAARRALTGISLRQFATRVGVAHVAVYGWEQGTSAPRPACIPYLAAYLGVTPLEIMLRLYPMELGILGRSDAWVSDFCHGLR